MEGLVAQPLLEVGELGERALEAALLEHDAGVAGEGLEQAAVVVVEAARASLRAVADDEEPEGAHARRAAWR